MTDYWLFLRDDWHYFRHFVLNYLAECFRQHLHCSRAVGTVSEVDYRCWLSLLASIRDGVDAASV
ncbi:hypothetical protein, partial [Pseudomonas syringae group genomosp. 7]|uniref:hypothetical protein n=1 Tax=Pseudomonas syringae group genomosp. 7 TaxID=251699 RepID=UPI00376F6DAD